MSCPKHFSFNPHNTGIADICLPTCPVEFYSDHKYLINWYLQSITASVLLPYTLFLLIPYLFIYRRWEKALESTVFFLLFFFCLRFALPLFVFGSDYNKLICHSDISNSTKNDSWCLFSFLIGYFVAMVGSWVWLSFCLRLVVIINKMFIINQKYWYIITISWAVIYTVASIIIVLVKDKVEGDPNTMGCFISSGNGGWYIDGLWFIPITIIMGIGVLAMIVSIIRMLSVIPRKSIFKFLLTQWRMIAFVLFYTYAILCFIIYRYVVRAQTSKINKSVLNWYTCFATTNGTSCGQPSVPNYGITIWVSYGLILAAVQFCLIFSVGNSDIINWWLWRVGIKKELILTTYSDSAVSGEESKQSMSPRSRM